MKTKILTIQILLLAQGQVGTASATGVIGALHDDLDCTLCHVIKPIWEVDTIETAPLLEGFACSNCHEVETDGLSSLPGGSKSDPPPPEHVKGLGSLGIGTEYIPATDTWTATFDLSSLPGYVISLSLWVSCDGTNSVCGKPCQPFSEVKCGSGFEDYNASRCRYSFFFNGNCPTSVPPETGLILPTRTEPYFAHAYAITASECANSHHHIYSCVSTQFEGLYFEVDVPDTVFAAEEWQMTVTARDVNSNQVVTNYLGYVTFEVTLGEPYDPGAPKTGAIFPVGYQFDDDDNGSHTFDITTYTAGPLSIKVSDDNASTTGGLIVEPLEPHCVKTKVVDPTPNPDDPIYHRSATASKSSVGDRSTVASRGTTASKSGVIFVRNCPPIFVMPEYLPADGSSEALIRVGDPSDPGNPEVLITDMYGNIIFDGLVTVETTVGTIVTPDEDMGISGIQVVVDTGVAEFRVQAGTVGVQGVVKVSSLSGTEIAQDSLTIVKIEMVTPAGDPVNSPVNSGDGQNEFTFSAASPGVLTMNLKAKVSPSGVAGQIGSLCHFTVDGVGSSALVWDSNNPGGLPTASDDTLLATVTFSGLPANNSDFGLKKATIFLNNIKAAEENYEVFFDRDATNNPGGSDPNWFDYWNQAAPTPNTVYEPLYTGTAISVAMHEWHYATQYPKDLVTVGTTYPLGAFGRQYTTGEYFTGIDNYIGAIIHELKHIDQIALADLLVPSSGNDSFRYGWSWGWGIASNHWSKGPDGEWGFAGVDDDSNSIIDDAAVFPDTTYIFEPGKGDDVSLEHPMHFDWPLAWPVPGHGLHQDPIEDEAVWAADQAMNEDDHYLLDWGSPGKQHNTLRKWDD